MYKINVSHKHKLLLILFSIFSVWHIVAIVIVGPHSYDYRRSGWMSLFQDYIGYLHLNRSWHFYAPQPSRGLILQYRTYSRTAGYKNYELSRSRNQYEHSYFRYSNFYTYLLSDPQYSKQRGFDRSVAHYLCKQHAHEELESIDFIMHVQKPFLPEHYRQGKRADDDEFLKQARFGPYPCS